MFFSDVYWINGGSRSRSSQVKSEPSTATAGCFHSGHLELVLVCNRGFPWNRTRFHMAKTNNDFRKDQITKWERNLPCLSRDSYWVRKSPEFSWAVSFWQGRSGLRTTISKFFRVFFWAWMISRLIKLWPQGCQMLSDWLINEKAREIEAKTITQPGYD